MARETTAERVLRVQNMDKDEAAEEAIALGNKVFDALEAVQSPEAWSADDDTRCTVNLSLSEWAVVCPAVIKVAAEDGIRGHHKAALWAAQIAEQVAQAMIAAQTVAAIPAETALSA